MAMAAAATTRRLTGGLLGGGDSKICSLSSLMWVRRMVEQPESAKVPSEAEGKKATSAPAKDAKSNVCAVLSAQSPSMPSAEGKKAASTPAKDAKSNAWNMEITSTILGAMGGCAIAGILVCILAK